MRNSRGWSSRHELELNAAAESGRSLLYPRPTRRELLQVGALAFTGTGAGWSARGQREREQRQRDTQRVWPHETSSAASR